MAQIATVSLVATSGTITIAPLTGQSGVTPATWRQTGASSIQAAASATLLVARASKENMRATLRYRQPVIRSVDGLETIVGTITYEVKATLPVSATSAELIDAHERAVKLLDSTPSDEAFEAAIATY